MYHHPCFFFFFFQAEDGIRDYKVTGVQTCALPIWQRQQALEGRVGPVTLVLVAGPLFLADDLARLLVEDAARDVHRRELLLEEALLLGPRGSLLGLEGVTVLGLAADPRALCDDPRG